MKKSKAVELLLKKSSSLVNEAQALETIAILEEIGMKPPTFVALMANGREFNQKTDCGRDTMFLTAWENEE